MWLTSKHERQRLDQRARARDLRAFLGQPAGQRQPRIGLGHLQPAAPALLRVPHHLHAPPARLGQQGGDLRGIDVGVDHDQRRRRLQGIVLLGAARRKAGLVAQMPAAAHHGEVDAGEPAVLHDRKHVGIGIRSGGVDRLLVQHARQRAELVAHRGCLLEAAEFTREILHAGFHLAHHVGTVAFEEAHGAIDVVRVARGIDQSDARRAAAMDLVQQAGPRAVRVHGVFAGAQAKDLLQQLDAVLDRPGVRVRAEDAGAPVDRAAVVGHAREGMLGELQVRVGLVVAEHHVVARRQRLDQVVLEQQRLGLGARDRRLDAHDPLEHVGDARPDALVEIGGDALLQVARLADIKGGAGGIEHPVDAGQVRQSIGGGTGVEGGGSVGHDLIRCAEYNRGLCRAGSPDHEHRPMNIEAGPRSRRDLPQRPRPVLPHHATTKSPDHGQDPRH